MSTKLLSTPEAANALGVTVARVQQLIWEGRLPAQKVGGSYVIQAGDLELVRKRPTGRPPKDDGQKKADRDALKRKALARWEGEGGKEAPTKKAAKKKGK